MNTAEHLLESQCTLFLIPLSNDFNNKEMHSNARSVFQMLTLCQHLFMATGRPDALLLRQAVGKASGQPPRLPGVTTELTTLGSSKTHPD